MISHCEFAVRYKKSEIHIEVQVLSTINDLYSYVETVTICFGKPEHHHAECLTTTPLTVSPTSSASNIFWKLPVI